MPHPALMFAGVVLALAVVGYALGWLDGPIEALTGKKPAASPAQSPHPVAPVKHLLRNAAQTASVQFADGDAAAAALAADKSKKWPDGKFVGPAAGDQMLLTEIDAHDKFAADLSGPEIAGQLFAAHRASDKKILAWSKVTYHYGWFTPAEGVYPILIEKVAAGGWALRYSAYEGVISGGANAAGASNPVFAYPYTGPVDSAGKHTLADYEKAWVVVKA